LRNSSNTIMTKETINTGMKFGVSRPGAFPARETIVSISLYTRVRIKLKGSKRMGKRLIRTRAIKARIIKREARGMMIRLAISPIGLTTPK